MKELVIVGAKNFAEIAHYFFSRDSEYAVTAFAVDSRYMDESSFKGLPIVALEELEKDFPPERCDVFVAIGIEKINSLRARKVRELAERGYRLASFVSSRTSTAPDLVVRPNTMIMDQVILHPQVTIGEDVVIWSNSRVALKTELGAHCWITSAAIGESVKLGEYTFVGLNATVAPFLTVGKRNIIGAGALILRDTSDDAVYRGPESRPSKVPSYRLKI